MSGEPERLRDTREGVEDEYRHDFTDALLDAYNEGRLALDGLADIYNKHFGGQNGTQAHECD